VRGFSLPRWVLRQSVGVGISIFAFGGLTAALAATLGDEQLLDVALLYLLLTLVASGAWGYWVGLSTAVMANLLLNYFFVPPLHTFEVQQPENVMSLLLFLAVAWVGATMLEMLRGQAEMATAGQTEAGVLLSVSQAIGRASSPEDALTALCNAVAARLGVQRCLVLRFDGDWTVAAASGGPDDGIGPLERESAAAAAQTGTVTRLADARRTFIPFPSGTAENGVLLLVGRILTPRRVDREGLLRAVAAEAGVALHRVQLAEEARRVGQLERADTLRSTLLSSVSHDLRSPLTAIKAAVGSLRDPDVRWSASDTARFLATVETQADRLSNVVSELLEMARLEAGNASIHLEPVEVSLLLRDVVQAAEAATAGRVVTVDAPSGLWTRADYRLLMQALGNLVENAARYSVPGGTIRLSAEAAGRTESVAISVADEGPGIPDEDLPHVFEPFYRGVQGRRSRGTGLGLAIARAMIELSGGSISVRSSLRSTVFSVSLPNAVAP